MKIVLYNVQSTVHILDSSLRGLKALKSTRLMVLFEKQTFFLFPECHAYYRNNGCKSTILITSVLQL